MSRFVAVAAIASSVAAFLVTFSAGVFLAATIQSGERAAGLVLALFSLLALTAALSLVFVPQANYRGRRWQPIWIALTLLAAIPVATLAVAALYFVGLPVGSVLPRLDWSLFAIGIGLAIGAGSILVTGWRRVRPGAAPHLVQPEPPVAGRPLKERANPALDLDDEVRVTPA